MADGNTDSVEAYIGRQAAIRELQAKGAFLSAYGVLYPWLLLVGAISLGLSTWMLLLIAVVVLPLSVTAVRVCRATYRQLDKVWREDRAAADARQDAKLRGQTNATSGQ
jgi:hypothetical protein